MKLVKRKQGSQRTSRPITLTTSPNFSGQGGYDFISFYDKENKTWYSIHPESIDEVKELMSQAHILYHNFGETR